jgi:hypothetical protein
MGGGGGSHTEQVRNRDPYTPEMLAMDAALYNQFMPMYDSYGADLAGADESYGKYGQQYDDAYKGLQDLTGTGQLPAGMSEALNDYLTREMNRSLGSAMAENAGKGILNSSVTSKAIGEIGSNTADAFAKNYGQMLGQASQNYGTLMSGAADAKSRIYDDINNKYAGAFNYWQKRKESEDMPDYDTVVHQDGK